MMLPEILNSIAIEDIHRRLGGTRGHTLYQQMVNDLRDLRERDESFVRVLLKDVERPAVCHNPEFRAFYGGMVCLLNLLLGQHDAVHAKVGEPGEGHRLGSGSQRVE